MGPLGRMPPALRWGEKKKQEAEALARLSVPTEPLWQRVAIAGEVGASLSLVRPARSEAWCLQPALDHALPIPLRAQDSTFPEKCAC